MQYTIDKTRTIPTQAEENVARMILRDGKKPILHLPNELVVLRYFSTPALVRLYATEWGHPDGWLSRVIRRKISMPLVAKSADRNVNRSCPLAAALKLEGNERIGTYKFPGAKQIAVALGGSGWRETYASWFIRAWDAGEITPHALRQGIRTVLYEREFSR